MTKEGEKQGEERKGGGKGDYCFSCVLFLCPDSKE